MERAIDTFRQRLRLRRYAKNTIKTYFGCLSKFLRAFEAHDLRLVAEKNIERYLSHLVEKEGIGDSYQKQMLCATSACTLTYVSTASYSSGTST
jgi:site-specific recombinase XerD